MKIGRLVLIIFIVLLIGLLGFAFWLHQAMHEPVAHDHGSTYIRIEQGATSNGILQVLAEQDILQEQLATKIYLRVFDTDAKMEAGDFKFPSPISPIEVIRLLEHGTKRTKTLTIPEGWTRFEIAKRLAKQFPVTPPITEKEVLALMNDTRLIQEFDPNAENIEGYLYPSTYEFELGTHPKDVIAKLVQQFKSVWDPDWNELILETGKTKHEIVILASLIENETKIASERDLVASVIYNRLDQGIPLGIDATNVYIAKLLGRWDGIIHKSDVEVVHPYNTRKIRGLPPGPISSPSTSAIEAAIHPAQTDYIYYVLNVAANDGSHHFYSTAQGFAKGKAQYQKWLAGQRRN